ncbi:MAG: uracil-xanthine permease family protein [Oscillospiraceae bacterium]|jgi:uracil permease|nr:uracil-xanthine permease family protein [Oscillospiraceae bacterium]
MNVKNVLTGGDKPGRAVTLGIQHVFAMFGSTVLVPALTGLDPAVTLLCMGIGTLIFHLITRGIVPAFMGSSFSFIASIGAVSAYCADNGISGFASYVGWGIIASGVLYLLLAGLVKLVGAKRVTSFFPPVVTGCMIIIIGMMLAPTAMNNIVTVPGAVPQGAIVQAEDFDREGDYAYINAGSVSGWALKANLAQAPDVEADEANGIEAYSNSGKDYTVKTVGGISLLEEASADASTISGTATWKNWVVAIFTVLVIIVVMFFAKGFLKLIPILIGIVAGYLLAMALGMVNTASVVGASWFAVPKVSLPAVRNWSAIIYAITMIAPISVVTFVEHVGDITANGAVTGHNYIEEPGLHRTLLGCGLASVFSGMMGGPAATTYSENTGVLAATRNYNPATLRIAAVFAIALSLFGKVSGVLQSIPAPVMGGVSVVLFGMIASVGLRMLVEYSVDFTKSRNLIIAAVMLVIGLGLSSGISIGSVSISGTAIAAVLGVVLNKILPKKESGEEA